jgi:hypothetical protein
MWNFSLLYYRKDQINYKIKKSEKSVRLDGNKSDDGDSVVNEYWQEYESKQMDQERRKLIDDKDPIKLLNRLEQYSKEELINMSWNDKEEMINQIEHFTKQGVTPLQKFYTELNKHSSLPSTQLIKYDKDFFMTHVQKIRLAQKQETANIMKRAEIAAKKVLEKMMERVKESLHKEMGSILTQFNKVRNQLFDAEVKMAEYNKTLIELELYVIELQFNTIAGKFIVITV